MIPSEVALACLLTAVTAASIMRSLVRPAPRLGPQVRPYVASARSAMGRVPDVGPLASGGAATSLGRVFGPMLRRIARRVGGLVDRMGDAALGLRLRQAGMYGDRPEEDRVAAYRMRQLLAIAGWGGGAVLGAFALGLGSAQGLVFVGLGLVVGATRQRGRLERAIEDRRRRMRIEIYTVNQLLALRVRAGGGVVQAVGQLCARGRGEVIAELGEALRLHRAGLPAREAFERIATLTPEPACARTYGLLAIAEDRGVDLAGGLLALSEDVREARREAIRRSATKRRAAMLVPTIAILAPVMLLFVGAPLPSLLLGFR